MLLDDLASGTLPIEDDVCSAKEAWDYYKDLIEFKLVPFSQFERQLRKHRETTETKEKSAQKAWSAFKEMRKQHPEPTVYDNGKKIFRHSEAYKILRDDVYAKRHHGYSPSAFRLTNDEYKKWDLDEFTQRIYQMERQWKFINYLEVKRAEKKKAVEDAREKAAYDLIKQIEVAKMKEADAAHAKKRKWYHN